MTILELLFIHYAIMWAAVFIIGVAVIISEIIRKKRKE